MAELDADATTLIFKLSKKLTQKERHSCVCPCCLSRETFGCMVKSTSQDFLDTLNFYWQPPRRHEAAYDFVHLPWKKSL